VAFSQLIDSSTTPSRANSCTADQLIGKQHS
jgi:hypothetical protein